MTSLATIENSRPAARGWNTFTHQVTAATPAHRDRAIDGLRALATVGVIVGHWLVGALIPQSDGALRISSPLRTLEGLAPASWFLQMLGLFFLVGGYSSALSLRRSGERGESYAGWLGQRFVRLGRPVVGAVALSAASLMVLGAIGVPSGTLRTWVVLLIQPFWFVAVYLALTALTKYAMAADRRLGGWAALPLIGVVALADLLRYGPWQDSMPGWIGMINLVPGWLFAYQLGVSWAQGRIARRGAWLLVLGGAAVFVLLITAFDYPLSMVGVPGADRTNSHPPSLLVPALAAVQSGLAILLHRRLNQVLRRPGLWAGVALVNLSAMTIFCWHQVPMVLVSMAGAAVGDVAGLTTAPTDLAWVLARIGWLPVMGVVLAGVVAVTRRFDAPWSGMSRAVRVLTGVLALVFVGFAAALY
ncbi:acyltransferase family protein [Actinopolymorpha alba]|uniref:acyltransferase family protein n=1 Tax=Actinopolymorpha alba TaxID=533267 RepID=UPI00037FEECB|nr:acyltransferase [Actinopolymorpha alba]